MNSFRLRFLHASRIVRSENVAEAKNGADDGLEHPNKPSEKVVKLAEEVMNLNMYESIQFLEYLKVIQI